MRLSCRRACLAIVLLLPAVSAMGAAPFRLHSARGVLQLQQPFPRTGSSDAPIVLYKEPGVGRLTSLTFPQMAQTIPSFSWDGESLRIPAVEQKRGWVRIPCDESGRECWLQLQRGWEVLEWSDLLPGMQVHFVAGMKKSLYVLLPDPATPAEATSLSPDEPLWILAVRGEWAQVETGSPRQEGWVRWRDDDGRLTVVPLAPEKH